MVCSPDKYHEATKVTKVTKALKLRILRVLRALRVFVMNSDQLTFGSRYRISVSRH